MTSVQPLPLSSLTPKICRILTWAQLASLRTLTCAQDVMIQFFVPFTHPMTHELISDHRAIARRYVKSWLIIDVVSIFPFDFVGGGDPNASRFALFRVVRLLRLAKLLRVVRASRILSRWRNRVGISHSTLSLAKFFLIIILVSHWSACVFHLAGAIQEDSGNLNWIRVVYGKCPEFEFAKDCLREDLFLPDVTSPLRDGLQRYLGAVYWSVATIATIGYGDITAETDAERAVALLTMLLGGGVYAYIVGAVYGIVSSMDRASMEYHAHMDHLNKFMEEIHYPLEERFAIRAYFDAFKRLFRQQYYQGLLHHLSPALRQKVALHMHAEWLDSIPYFNAPNRHEREDFITAVAVVLQPQLFSPLETILRLGYVNTKLFIIQRGLAIVRSRVVGSGLFFGDTWILTNGRCTDSVRSITYLYVMTLSKAALNRTLESGNFEATRRLIRKAVIRLAIRREFLKCAALAKLQSRVTKRLRAELEEDDAKPQMGRMESKVDTPQRSLLGGLGGSGKTRDERARHILETLGGNTGRQMVELSDVVDMVSGSKHRFGRGTAAAIRGQAAAGATAARIQGGHSNCSAVSSLSRDGDGSSMRSVSQASNGNPLFEDGGALRPMSTFDDGATEELDMIATTSDLNEHLGDTPSPSVDTGAGQLGQDAREKLAHKWQQLHADMPLLARIMLRANLPRSAKDDEEHDSALAQVLGIPNAATLDEGTLSNPNYIITVRGQRNMVYKMQTDQFPNNPSPTVTAHKHGGLSPSHAQRNMTTDSVAEVGAPGVAKLSTAGQRGPISSMARSSSAVSESGQDQPSLVRRESALGLGGDDLSASGGHSSFTPHCDLPVPAATSLDLRTAVAVLSGQRRPSAIFSPSTRARTFSSIGASQQVSPMVGNVKPPRSLPGPFSPGGTGQDKSDGYPTADVSDPAPGRTTPDYTSEEARRSHATRLRQGEDRNMSHDSKAPAAPSMPLDARVARHKLPEERYSTSLEASPSAPANLRLQVRAHQQDAMLDDSVPASASARRARDKLAADQRFPHHDDAGGVAGMSAVHEPDMSVSLASGLEMPRSTSLSVSTTTVLRRITETSTAITSVKADMSRDLLQLMQRSTTVLKEVQVLRMLVIALVGIVLLLMTLVGVTMGAVV